MGVVTPEIVKHVAHLARMRVEGEALTQLAAQLDEILDYVRKLQAVATDGIEPTSHVLPLTNVQRPDAPRPSLDPGTVVALAPARSGPFLSVPKVLEA